mgnify:CR=1 FL=1
MTALERAKQFVRQNAARTALVILPLAAASAQTALKKEDAEKMVIGLDAISIAGDTCDLDMTKAMEDRIEQFAPGFRDVILARRTMTAPELQSYNPNYVGGDINGGVSDLLQFLTRPVPSLDPWSTPVDGLFLCSSSTPPGGGVHGMCGRAAARSVLRRHPL